MGPTSTIAYVGTNATFTCTVSGTPPPMIYWYRIEDGGDLQVVDSDEDVVIVYNETGGVYFTSLTLLDVGPDDDGGYYCQASNEISAGMVLNTSEVAQLTIYCESTFLTLILRLKIAEAAFQPLSKNRNYRCSQSSGFCYVLLMQE